MVVRLLAAFLTVTVLMLALGSTERVVVADSALTQGLTMAVATDIDGSVEDHHLDDLPTTPAAEPVKLDPMATVQALQVAPASSATGAWMPTGKPATHRAPVLEGLLRPPCQCA